MTRPRPVSGEDPFVGILRVAGALPVHTPLTEILPPQDPRPLQAAAREISHYDWIVFTSPRSINPFTAALAEAGADAGRIRDLEIRVCAVGPTTAEALIGAGLPVDLVPERFDADGVAEALAEIQEMERGGRVLLPRAEEGREVIPQRLSEVGISVDVVPVYRTVPVAEEVRRAVDLVRTGEVDVLTFTSGSAVRAFASGWSEKEPPGVGIVVLGPSAAQALSALGYPVHQQARVHTLAGLMSALEEWAGS